MPNTVRAELSFLKPEWRDRSETPRIYSRESRLSNTMRQQVEIHDARPLHQAGQLDLNRNGFVVVNHETSFTDFDDRDAVKRDYYPEMAKLAQQATDADAVVAFPYHQVRSRNPADFFDAYSLYVHCDFSDSSWLALVKEAVESSGFSHSEAEWNYSLFNLWRPIRNAALRDPLVLIDRTTVNARDIVEYQLSTDPNSVRASLPIYNESQRFNYVSELAPHEVLIFKQYDTRFPGSQVCPHSSFSDPTTPLDAPERKSIEVRMICLFRKP